MINNKCNSNPYPLTFQEQGISYICRYEYDFFFNKPNVVALGLGYKQINDVLTNQKCIVVFVTKKLPCYMLSSDSLIPNKFNNLLTDVLESGEFFLTQSLKDRIRPTVGGCSIGNATRNFSGTLGCLVKDDKGIYILGNNHVLTDYNTAQIGSPIIQPGASDKGKVTEDIVAYLDRFIYLKSNPLINEVDCALAKVNDFSLASPNIAVINAPPKGVDFPLLQGDVKKVGKNTGLTTGKIITISTTIKLNNLTFVNQILCNAFGGSGDSGAIFLNNANKAIGLMNASSSIYSSGALIDTVLNRLNVTLVTG